MYSILLIFFVGDCFHISLLSLFVVLVYCRLEVIDVIVHVLTCYACVR